MRFDLLLAAATAIAPAGTPTAPPVSAPHAAAADTLPDGARYIRQAARAVLSGVGIESGTASVRTRNALTALRVHVRQQSDPDALRMAFRAYYNFKEMHPEQVRKPYLYFVDYGLDTNTPRGYVFDMEALRVVDGPFTVAHGRGSELGRSGTPSYFTARHGSYATSLGLFLAQETYSFVGKDSGSPYRSIGLRLAGLSGAFNSTARSRGVVMHGAPYVTSMRAGRSQGCPAIEQWRAYRLIPQIANGSLVFLFSPRDRNWLNGDPWAARGNG